MTITEVLWAGTIPGQMAGVDDLAETVARLAKTVEGLEQRVRVLERQEPAQAMPALPPAGAMTREAVTTVPLAEGGSLFSLMGKAMLCVAGAYLLRALAESSVLPQTPVVAIAIAYALVWLLPAARVPLGGWFPSTAWAGTSALILLPMLWELTLKFQLLPDAATAAILAGYVLAASAIAWKRNFAAVVWVTEASASLVALLLAVMTRDPAPFVAALLVIATAGEFAASRKRGIGVRPVVALAADSAIFTMIFVYSAAASTRPDYRPLSTAVLLSFGPAMLAIYAASATVQTLFMRQKITSFETAQTLVAFALAVWSVLAFWSGPAAMLLGALCLAGAALGYGVVYLRFDRARERRNYHVYATGSLALLLVGSYFALAPRGTVALLGVAAVAATAIGIRMQRLTLKFHALTCLAAAAFTSGLLAMIAQTLAGAALGALVLRVAFAAACAMGCYAAVLRWPQDSRFEELFRLPLATLAAASTTALLVVWLARLAAATGAHQLAVIRTLVTCAMALMLAWGGSRRQRSELATMAWVALVFVAFKLLYEDLRHGHLGFTAASIFLFAITLLLAPRLMRKRQRVAVRVE